MRQDAASPHLKIRIESLSKSFAIDDKQKLVLDGINLTVAEREFVSVVGPSGCGKSTLLNVIAGLEEQDTGLVKVEGVPDNWRLGKISYMQQKDLLFPWRTVLDNTILGLEINRVTRKEARKKALELVEAFGLKGFENQYPFVLSGGMRQRAAFLRTMLLNEDVLLLDEPFGALDALTRTQMREWLLELWSSLHKTIIFVTHDIDEALLLSDRVYVLTKRPARVAMVLEVSLSRPRDFHQLVSHKTFLGMKAKIISRLHEEKTPAYQTQLKELPL